MIKSVKLALLFLVATFVVAPEVYAALSGAFMEKISSATQSQDSSTIKSTVEQLAKENPELASDIASETAKLAPESLACVIAAAAITGSNADAIKSGNIVGAVASAIGSSTEELRAIISCVSVALQLNPNEITQMMEVAMIVGGGLDPTAAGQSAARKPGFLPVLPGPPTENPRQFAASAQ